MRALHSTRKAVPGVGITDMFATYMYAFRRSTEEALKDVLGLKRDVGLTDLVAGDILLYTYLDSKPMAFPLRYDRNRNSLSRSTHSRQLAVSCGAGDSSKTLTWEMGYFVDI